MQAPIVAGALVVAVEPAARALRREGHVHGTPDTRRRDVVIANIGFALVFAALVGALFLGVLLAIEVWRYSPLQSAVLVSALPLGMIVGRWCRPAPSTVVVLGGAALLATGLIGLAMLPGARPSWPWPRSPACGAGFDLLHEVLDGAAVPADGPAIRASAVSVGARHAGLVLGLALIAPVLSTSIEHGIDRATLGATRTMLTADLELREKLTVTWDLRTVIEEAPRGEVPDLASVFEEAGADGDNALARARDDLLDTVTDAVTRSFRPAFGIAAALAALAAVPALLVAAVAPPRRVRTAPRRRPPQRRRCPRRGGRRPARRRGRRRRPVRSGSSRPRTRAPPIPTRTPVTASTPHCNASPSRHSTERRASWTPRASVSCSPSTRTAATTTWTGTRRRWSRRCATARSGPSTTRTNGARSPAGPRRPWASSSIGPRSTGCSRASRSAVEVCSPPDILTATASASAPPTRIHCARCVERQPARTSCSPTPTTAQSSPAPPACEPPVEVPLTRARPRRTTAADLRRTVAWLLFGAFGMTTLLAGTKSDPRTGDLIASNLVVPLFVLTVGALVWVALDALMSTFAQRRPGEREVLRANARRSSPFTSGLPAPCPRRVN